MPAGDERSSIFSDPISAPRKEVSLRGASAKEISRDALLQKVSQERELRKFTRRASAAALFIQRVWRRYYVMKKVAERIREGWRALACQSNHTSCRWICRHLIRPFLFFTTKPSTQHQMLQPLTVDCMLLCFKVILQSINTVDTEENYCSLTAGTLEDKHIWLYQAKKMVSLCLFILAECDQTALGCENIVPLTALATRLVVTLTDPKGWKSFKNENIGDADIAANKLLEYMTASRNSFYICIRRYLMKLSLDFPSQKEVFVSTDDNFLITASAITLVLRPFHLKKLNESGIDRLDVQDAYAQYVSFILTVPYLTRRLPPLLLPALKHESTLLPCLTTLLVLADFEGQNLKCHVEIGPVCNFLL